MIQAWVERRGAAVRSRQLLHSRHEARRRPPGVPAVAIDLIEGGREKHGHVVVRRHLDRRLQDRIGIGADGQQGHRPALLPEPDQPVDDISQWQHA